MDEHRENCTQSGAHSVLSIEQEMDLCSVSVEADHIGSIQFNFNPDFPQDAKAFFNAIVEVRSIIHHER